MYVCGGVGGGGRGGGGVVHMLFQLHSNTNPVTVLGSSDFLQKGDLTRVPLKKGPLMHILSNRDAHKIFLCFRWYTWILNLRVQKVEPDPLYASVVRIRGHSEM